MSEESLASRIFSLARDNPHISDFYIREKTPLMVKLPAGLRQVDNEPVTKNEIEAFLSLPGAFGANWDERLNDASGTIDAGCTLAETSPTPLRIRLAVNRVGGADNLLNCVLRVGPAHPPDVTKLEIPTSIQDLANRRRGLLLITGPTGAGKTTTMMSLLAKLAQNPLHILSIEAPIEYILKPGPGAMISQIEVPTNAGSFHQALHGAMRLAINVIAIGEVRDRDTVETMLSAAASGHLVMATMHTTNPEQTINRLLSFYPDKQEGQAKLGELSASLLGIVGQVLVPSSDGSRRRLATEVLINTRQVAAIIKDGKLNQLRMLMDNAANGHPMHKTLNRLLQESAITLDAAKAALDDPDLYSKLTTVRI